MKEDQPGGMTSSSDILFLPLLGLNDPFHLFSHYMNPPFKVTSNNGAETQVLLRRCCGKLVGPPRQPHVEDDQWHDSNRNRPNLG